MPGTVRATMTGDAEIVAAVMRQADVEEVAANSGLAPLPALLRCVSVSEICCTVINEAGQPVALFGATSEGCVWMLGSDALTQPPLRRQFLNQCRWYVDRLQDRHPVLFNHIDARNTVHIRWLKWMGFTFIKRHPSYGSEGRPFLEFVRVSNV